MDKRIQGIRDEIVRRVRTVADPDRIILFGSAATGQMTRDSDVDLMVLLGSSANTRNDSVRISDALRRMGFAFDVFVMNTERFESEKDVIGGLAYPANKQGEVVYARF